MALRLHSRLVLWNLFLVSLASFILSFFLTASQLALMIVVAVAAAFIFTYGVHVLVLRPLHRISLVSRKLASGNLDERLPIAGDEQIAALGTSLITMAGSLLPTVPFLECWAPIGILAAKHRWKFSGGRSWRTLLKPSFAGSLLRLWRSPLERTEFCKPMSHP